MRCGELLSTVGRYRRWCRTGESDLASCATRHADRAETGCVAYQGVDLGCGSSVPLSVLDVEAKQTAVSDVEREEIGSRCLLELHSSVQRHRRIAHVEVSEVVLA